jgi:hypothetical protein
MMQYVPRNGLYVYFRFDTKQTILCAMNTDSTTANLDASRYAERTAGFSRATDVLSGKEFPLTDAIGILPGQMLIMELRK